jgi:homoserine kinase
LTRLLPLAGVQGILGVALSGAGSAVLVIVGNEESVPGSTAHIRMALDGLAEPELKICRFESTGASRFLSMPNRA